MTLAEAYEAATDILQTSDRDKSPKNWDAINLICMGAKRLLDERTCPSQSPLRLLPGETEK